MDGYTFEIEENGNVKLLVPIPEVSHTISPDTKVAEGTKITITIQATITEGSISKITKPDGSVVNNVNETTYEVTENGKYKFIVEGSNKGKTTYEVEIANIIETEKFSDIYTTTSDYTDKNGKTAKIPAGFAVGVSNTINTVENGLVITDSIDINHKSTGNEFVWVPVDNINNFKRIAGYEDGSLQSLSLFQEPSPATCGSSAESDYNTMKSRVEKSHGFYMGRYEPGLENNKVVVKKNKVPITNVKLASSMNYSTSFKNDKSYKNIITSSLCYSVQWDVTLQFFNDNTYFRNSTGRGWYSDNWESGNPEHKTGIDLGKNASNRVKNIYDMAGNVFEWTMEGYPSSSRYPHVVRGGSYSETGSYSPASNRDNLNPTSTYTYPNMSFRITFCLNV